MLTIWKGSSYLRWGEKGRGERRRYSSSLGIVFPSRRYLTVKRSRTSQRADEGIKWAEIFPNAGNSLKIRTIFESVGMVNLRSCIFQLHFRNFRT